MKRNLFVHFGRAQTQPHVFLDGNDGAIFQRDFEDVGQTKEAVKRALRLLQLDLISTCNRNTGILPE